MSSTGLAAGEAAYAARKAMQASLAEATNESPLAKGRRAYEERHGQPITETEGDTTA